MIFCDKIDDDPIERKNLKEMRDLSRRRISKSKVPVSQMIGLLSVNCWAALWVCVKALRLEIISIVTSSQSRLIVVREFN
jgi:hypothetical protein